MLIRLTGIKMKRLICSIFLVLPALVLCGCITEFEADIDEVEDLLVVEGIITDDESIITLSRSKGLSYEDNLLDLSPYHVTDAKVSIECDDGTQWNTAGQDAGQYTIQIGKLNSERQYRLKIELEAQEYLSEYAYPMATPEIDSVFWTKKDSGQPVNIHLATHASDGMVHYYRWSYREDWETRARISGYGPSLCSKHNHSKGLLLGTNEKNSSGQLIEILTETHPRNDRLSVLYRIDVKQHAISKRAFEYYTNIKKNAQKTGRIFAHVPSELKGNISCTTDPALMVIGYVDVSSATHERLYIYRDEDVYEQAYNPASCYRAYQSGGDYTGYVNIDGFYVEQFCINCQLDGGRPIEELPDDWPYKYGED